jgi:Bacterial Ig-like domain (group 3)/NHL repeat
MGQQTMQAKRTTVRSTVTTADRRLRRGAALLFAMLGSLFVATRSLPAQGILTIIPGRAVATTAGTGAMGFAGDGSMALAGKLANPSAVAYDANGNLYVADAQNHVVRRVSTTGTISTIAGTGIEGYGGDGAAATAALLDTPSGIAVDRNGNVYIADSHNQRIRKVSAGMITTIAGTGTPGFAGDGAAATSAQLWLPVAVAVDSNGNVYIADSNNQRVRMVIGNIIQTIAGNGEEWYAGDGGTALSAALDTPTGVAVDSSGNVYVADRHNHRVRMIAASSGAISTVAGSGAASFSGGFSGDGAAATAATLAKPSGVSVDVTGNIYIADTGNQRIRQVGGGQVTTGGSSIATIIGSGQQGYGTDGTTSATVNLNAPKAVAPDAAGNLAISDTLNQRVRTAALPTLVFAISGIGVASPTQSVAMENTGTASITVATIAFNGPFAASRGGTCGSLPVTLAAGASCTENIVFFPAAVGSSSGSAVFGGLGIVPQSILLAGSGVQTATNVILSCNAASSFVGQSITFTATVTPTGSGIPSGTASFYDGVTLIGTGLPLIAGSTSIPATTLSAGRHNMTAVYSGDANFLPNTSGILAQSVFDFGFIIAPTSSTGDSGTGSGSGSGMGGSSQTVAPGQPVTYGFTLQPIGGTFPFPVTLSATGLPPGATVTFNPQVISFAAGPANFTMVIQTAAVAALEHKHSFGGEIGGGTVALGLLLLPFSRRMRRRGRGLRPLMLCGALILFVAMIGGLSGCGTGSGFFGQRQQTYTVNIVGTATGAAGSVQRYAAVTLTVQ